jgi:phosphatidylglycerophosphatase C
MAQDHNDASPGPENSEAGRSIHPDAAPIVAFDFDGTLTVRDSFTAFLAWRAGPVGYAIGFIRLIPAALAYLIHRDRGRIKAASVAVYLKGVSREQLEKDAETFAQAHAARLFRPDALETWERWKQERMMLVIVTASPDVVVAPFARRLGADELLGTHLAYDAEGRVTGAFATENCRGAEKVDRLHARFGPDLKLTAAYGDTSGDTEMLAIAVHPGYRVFTGRP